GLTGTDGTYLLTVSATGIQDAATNAGTGSAADTWVKNRSAARRVTDVVDVTPDPRNTAVSTVDVLLSEVVNLATFDFNDITLTLNGGSNLITGAVTVTFVSGTTYRINNLSGLTATDGTYLLTVSATGIQDAAGNAGTGSAADTWV